MQVYVINLDSDRSRLRRFRKVMDHLNVPFLRWPATRGADIDSRQLGIAPLEPGVFVCDFDQWSLNEAACGVSHIRLLRHIVSRAVPWTIVMEDDALLTQALPLDHAAWELPPGADIVMLSNRAHIGEDRIQGDAFSYGPVTGGAGTEAYLISLSGARKLLRVLYPLREPLDFQMYAHFASIQASDQPPHYWRLPRNPAAEGTELLAFRVEPSLAVHAGDISTIGNSRHPRAHFYCKVLLGLDFDNQSTQSPVAGYPAIASPRGDTEVSSADHAVGPLAANTIMWRGADVSHWDERIAYRAASTATERHPFDIVRDAGMNIARVSLWVGDETQFNLGRVLHIAEAAARRGLQLCVVLHYSDTWTDPNQQPQPSEWGQLSLDELAARVREYTRSIVSALAAQGTPPAIVQTGNEITNGFLWGEEGRTASSGGRLTGTSSRDWEPFMHLLSQAILGVRDGADRVDDMSRVMLHYDNGAATEDLISWFTRINQFEVDYDAIGVSLYDYWHSTQALETIRSLESVAPRFPGKEIIIAETSHPYRESPQEGGSDHVGDPPNTIEGQCLFVERALQAMRENPNGTGLFWWGSMFISDAFGHCPDFLQARALFDPHGVALPAMRAFKNA